MTDLAIALLSIGYLIAAIGFLDTWGEEFRRNDRAFGAILALIWPISCAVALLGIGVDYIFSRFR